MQSGSLYSEQSKALQAIKMIYKNPKDILKAVEQTQEEKQQLGKQLERIEAKLLVGIRNELVKNNR